MSCIVCPQPGIMKRYVSDVNYSMLPLYLYKAILLLTRVSAAKFYLSISTFSAVRRRNSTTSIYVLDSLKNKLNIGLFQSKLWNTVQVQNSVSGSHVLETLPQKAGCFASPHSLISAIVAFTFSWPEFREGER